MQELCGRIEKELQLFGKSSIGGRELVLMRLLISLERSFTHSIPLLLYLSSTIFLSKFELIMYFIYFYKMEYSSFNVEIYFYQFGLQLVTIVGVFY